MRNPKRMALYLLLWGLASTQAQTKKNTPTIGYLYPAGGAMGTTVRLMVGGQNLRSATDVYVSGEGVQATVVRHVRPLRNMDREQRNLLTQRLNEVRAQRLSELTGEDPNTYLPKKEKVTSPKKTEKPKTEQKDPDKKKPKEVTLPDHPLLDDLDQKSLHELAHIREILFFNRSKLQTNRQLAELLVVDVALAAGAKQGVRELRVGCKNGLTNPVVFQVAGIPEVKELEPNNRQAYPALSNLPKGVTLPTPKPLTLPVMLNGQIMPGDVDRFRFQAQQGQSLVIDTHARSLIPYLADAVPGWFQAKVVLYDAEGHEVAFADDYRFDPDPVLFYKIPQNGEYELEICDAIYRGREDFVYRISVGESPFVTQMFPLGGRLGVKTQATLNGWNMPTVEWPLDTSELGTGLLQTTYEQDGILSNAIAYAIDTLPEGNDEKENNTLSTAQAITLPKVINGRIETSGDVDVFQWQGRAGEVIVAEVLARQLNSPLDSLLRLTDASGKVLVWNDDFVRKDKHLYQDEGGLLTHHADSYLMTELPADGVYYLHLTDSQQHGGPSYGYRLRLSAPRPDFALRATPSSHYIQGAGGVVLMDVHVIRKDGFAGEIQVGLKGNTHGFELRGGRIPPGKNRIRMTLIAPEPREVSTTPVALTLEGSTRIPGRQKPLRRPVTPADDTMQAFLYRHLVPAQELMITVKKTKWRIPDTTLVDQGTVSIPAGGWAKVQIHHRRGNTLNQMTLALVDPPEGITIHEITALKDGFEFILRAQGEQLTAGFADNLIISATREYFPKEKDGTLSKKRRRDPMGIFPAIPIEIIAAAGS